MAKKMCKCWTDRISFLLPVFIINIAAYSLKHHVRPYVDERNDLVGPAIEFYAVPKVNCSEVDGPARTVDIPNMRFCLII